MAPAPGTIRNISSMSITNLRLGTAENLKTALITGATGLLGRDVARGLADDGWALALSARRIDALDTLARDVAPDAARLPGDLTEAGAGSRIADAAISALGPVHLFVHLASPPVIPMGLLESQTELDRQVTVNVRAFLDIATGLLPEMLRAQAGMIVPALSQALLPPAIPGWHAYIIAKAALAEASAQIASTYGLAGIRVIGVLPSLIAPKGEWRGAAPQSAGMDLGAAVDSDTVADAILDAVADAALPSGTAISVTSASKTHGRLTHAFTANDSDKADGIEPQPQVRHPSARSHRLENVIRDIFKLPADAPVSDGELGVMPEWDSLGHIKLIMAVEAEFDVNFEAAESTEITSFRKIDEALGRHGVA